MFLGIFATEFILLHFTYMFNIKGDLQLMLFSFCVHSCSCIMAHGNIPQVYYRPLSGPPATPTQANLRPFSGLH